MRSDHYCVVINRGKPVDNIYFEDELVAAYYYAHKYKIKFQVHRGVIISHRKGTVEIVRVKLDKRIVSI